MNFRPIRFLLGVALLPALAMAFAATLPPSRVAYQWHTFFGGDAEDAANKPATTVDANGNLYVTGATRFPWDGAGDPGALSLIGYQAYLAKISPTGQLIWSSFFANPGWPGRQDGLRPRAIALGQAGNIYIAGAGIIDPINCTSCGSFALETDTNGVFLGGVNFGGPSGDSRASSDVWGMTYNSADNYVYITGNAGRAWWGPGTVVTGPPGLQTMFVLQVGSLASGGSGLGWVGFYAPHAPYDGSAVYGQGIAADAASNLFVAGIDGSHVAVWKVSNAGLLAWENVYGLGNSYAAASDGANVYVTGSSPVGWNGPATQLPLNAFSYGSLSGGAEVFVLKLDTGGNYLWHTFYHGNWQQSIGEGIALDGPTKVYLTGPGDLAGYNGAPPLHNAAGGHFILQLDNAGAYQWHSLYGALPKDEATSIAVDSQHDVFVSGWTGINSWNGDADTAPLHPSSLAASAIFAMKFALAKTTPTITWSNPAGITYGAALGATQLNATANVAGAFVYTPPAGTVLHAGAGQTLSTNFTPAETADYNTATASVLIDVSKATPALTWAAPAPITFGSALGSGQLNASSAGVAGTFVYTPPAGTVLPVGNGQTLSATFTPSDAVDYNTPPARTTTINVNAAPPPPSGVSLVVTKVLSRADGRVSVQLTISNTGGTAANNVTLSGVKVGSLVATPLPQNVGTIVGGGSAQATVSVPGSVGGAGAASSLTAAGTYSGGIFSLSMRIVLP